MGSGSSSQVKTIESTSTGRKGSAVNDAGLIGNESATSKKRVSRTMPYPQSIHAPVAGHSDKTDAAPHDLVRKPSTSGLRQSSGDNMMPVTKVTPHRQETDTAKAAKAANTASSSISDLQKKLDLLQKELNESESEKLDLNDRIQALEEKLQEVMSASAAAPLAPPPVGSGGGGEGRKLTGGGVGVGGAGAPLEQTLHAKDQYIQQMEKQLAAAEAESKKVRLRLKKRIKALTCELSEARQEASINQLEMRERNQELQQQLSSTTTTTTTTSAATNSEGKETNSATETAAAAAAEDNDHPDSKMKIILDLSEEVSEQSQRISHLERQLKEKDRELEQLKKQQQQQQTDDINNGITKKERALLSRSQDETIKINDTSNSNSNNSNGYYSQAGGRPSMWQQMQQDKNRGASNFRQAGLASGATVAPVETTGMDYYRIPCGGSFGGRPVSKISGRPTQPHPQHASQCRIPPEDHLTLQRQSTALSDSDSDWELETPTSKIHSAPARTRMKSAAEDKHPSVTHRPPQRGGVDNKWNIATDDNDLTMTSEVGGSREGTEMVQQRENSSRAMRRQKRKSALKNRLERERDERSRELMGPTLAFAAPATDQLSDISSTPTPRHSCSDLGSQQFNTSEVMAFN